MKSVIKLCSKLLLEAEKDLKIRLGGIWYETWASGEARGD